MSWCRHEREGQGRAGQGRAGQGRAGQGRAGQGRLYLHDIDLGGRLATPDLDSERDGDSFSYPRHKPAQLGGLAQQRRPQTTPCCFWRHAGPALVTCNMYNSVAALFHVAIFHAAMLDSLCLWQHEPCHALCLAKGLLMRSTHQYSKIASCCALRDAQCPACASNLCWSKFEGDVTASTIKNDQRQCNDAYLSTKAWAVPKPMYMIHSHAVRLGAQQPQ